MYTHFINSALQLSIGIDKHLTAFITTIVAGNELPSLFLVAAKMSCAVCSISSMLILQTKNMKAHRMCKDGFFACDSNMIVTMNRSKEIRCTDHMIEYVHRNV